MNPQPTRNPNKAASEGSVAFFAILITLIALFLCTVAVVLTIRSCSVSVEGQGGLTTPPVTNEPSPPSPGKDTTPVFSPSSVTVLPSLTAETVTLSDEVDSRFAVLVDGESGYILASKGADQRIQPASMTKIMTLLVACQRLTAYDLEQDCTLTAEINDYVRPSSGGYLGADCFWPDVGDGASVLAQLYGIGVKSAADCSVMVACYLVGKSPAESEAQFVAWMNEEAEAMGLTNTHFDNVIGYDSPQNYTTPAELAAILLRALESPLIAEILATPSKSFQAYGYNSVGSFVQYPIRFYSTLFNANNESPSRIKAYESKYGSFSLSKGSFGGGKTGSLVVNGQWTYSLASFATDHSGKLYIVITADTLLSHAVMKDAKTLYDTYMP